MFEDEFDKRLEEYNALSKEFNENAEKIRKSPWSVDLDTPIKQDKLLMKMLSLVKTFPEASEELLDCIDEIQIILKSNIATLVRFKCKEIEQPAFIREAAIHNEKLSETLPFFISEVKATIKRITDGNE